MDWNTPNYILCIVQVEFGNEEIGAEIFPLAARNICAKVFMRTRPTTRLNFVVGVYYSFREVCSSPPTSFRFSLYQTEPEFPASAEQRDLLQLQAESFHFTCCLPAAV